MCTCHDHQKSTSLSLLLFFCGGWLLGFKLRAFLYHVRHAHPSIFALVICPGSILHFCPGWFWTVILLLLLPKQLGV
jgi:hypothetical protein